MAKWGEGDPRWIVEDRTDGTNVNNWHWTEKNASGWSKDKLKSLLMDLIIETNEGKCRINEVVSIDGEAVANNRKAKLIFFYEWHIKLNWEGMLTDSDEKINGTIEIPNLSEENSAEEIDISVSTKDNSDPAYTLKQIVHLKGSFLIRNQLAKYITGLKEEFSKGMILPSKDKTTNSNERKEEKAQGKENVAKKILNQAVESKPTTGVKISTKKLTTKVDFQCPPPLLYRSLTEEEMVNAFTQKAVSEFRCEKGGRFSFYGNTISGEFTELVLNEKIKMKWRLKDWPAAHYSEVTLTLDDRDGSTQLTLTQSGIPATDFDRTKDGWKNFYWDRIRQTFGYGAKLF
ncbi:activator of 90 kDa heat shock protein ATPase homolog 1-like [Tubulanus polymorphus]|uniref:activator of 90 kDa heat shock protein ATPase homolog 1-like n=1 Tax=Tubulanus polymorphus TaxID=672921 RepID=UPI003DA447D0